ncbi:MAG: sterol desaturase family protein [Bacteroidia bacterium]|nr:sterol desaturase family protein [Bacteroidia bacterium]
MNNILQYAFPFLVNFARYFILAGIPFLIFYLFFPGYFSKNKIQERLAKNKDFQREILHSLQTNVIIALIGILIIKTPFGSYTQIYTEVNSYPLWWIPVSVIVALIIHDSYFYWVHRSIHHPRLFRKVHLLHHRSINPSPWASYSFHLIEGILEVLIGPILIFILPMHFSALIAFTTASFFINVYGHLGYEIAPKWFRNSPFFEVFNTSVHHNLHHKKFNGNYGLYFRIWDRLMGTEHPDYVAEYDKMQEKRFGSSSDKARLQSKIISTMVILCLASVAIIGLLNV